MGHAEDTVAAAFFRLCMLAPRFCVKARGIQTFKSYSSSLPSQAAHMLWLGSRRTRLGESRNRILPRSSISTGVLQCQSETYCKSYVSSHERSYFTAVLSTLKLAFHCLPSPLLIASEKMLMGGYLISWSFCAEAGIKLISFCWSKTANTSYI